MKQIIPAYAGFFVVKEVEDAAQPDNFYLSLNPVIAWLLKDETTTKNFDDCPVVFSTTAITAGNFDEPEWGSYILDPTGKVTNYDVSYDNLENLRLDIFRKRAEAKALGASLYEKGKK